MAEDSFLKSAKPEEQFVLSNGRVLKNLHELRNALLSMDDGTFRYHVNTEKNDFSNWIRHVFGDADLADKIRSAGSAKEMIALLNGSQKKEKQDGKQKLLPGLKRQKAKPRPAPKKEASLPKPREEPELITEQETPEASSSAHADIEKKLDEVLLYEKELELREKKIQEIEERIEKELSGDLHTHSLSKDFIQGFVAGVLVTVIAILLYINLV